MLCRVVALIVTALVPLVDNSLAGVQAPAQSAETIITRMQAQYSHLASYQDNGTVDEVDPIHSSRRTRVMFRSYFARASRLRFDFTVIYPMNIPSQSFVLWCDGERTYKASITGENNIEVMKDLGVGISAATGISKGAAATISGLIVPSIVSESAVTELENLTLGQASQFEGDDCYRIGGRTMDGRLLELWIAKTSYLIRKVTTRQIDGTVEEEIHRQIRRNKPIPLGIFRLKHDDGKLLVQPNKSKELLIRRLLTLVIATESLNQIVADSLEHLKELLPQVPEDVWSDVTRDTSFNSEMIVQIYLPLFDKHYDEAEINQLIKFYQTPLGRKLARVSLLIEAEAGRKAEQKVSEFLLRIQQRLREKGYKTIAGEAPAAYRLTRCRMRRDPDVASGSTKL